MEVSIKGTGNLFCCCFIAWETVFTPSGGGIMLCFCSVAEYFPGQIEPVFISTR